MKLKSLLSEAMLLELDDSMDMYDIKKLKNAYDIAHYKKNAAQTQAEVHKYEQYLSIIKQALNSAMLRSANNAPKYNKDPVASNSIKNPDASSRDLSKNS